MILQGQEIKKIKGLEQYINVLKKIITIEEYFNIKFEIPNTIEDDDILNINKLYKYISDSREKIKATDIRFSLIKGQSEIERLKQLVYMERTSIMTVSEDGLSTLFQTIFIRTLFYIQLVLNNLENYVF